MSLTKKVFWNTGAQIISRGLMSLLGIVTFGLLTRYLGVSNFGDYTTVMAFGGLVTTVADFGFSVIVLRDLSLQDGEKKRHYFRISNFARTIFALVVSLLAVAILPVLGYSIVVKMGIAMVAISVIAQVQSFAIRNYLQVEYQVYKFVISEIIARVILLGGIFYVLNNDLGLIAIFVVTALSWVVQFLLGLVWIVKTKDYGFSYNSTDVRKLIQDSFWMGIVLILSFTYVKVDTVILSILKDSYDVGIYGAPYRIIEVVSTFPGMLMANLAPAVSQFAVTNHKKLKEVTTKIITAMGAISIPLFVGGSMLATGVIELAAGEEFVYASTVSIFAKTVGAPQVLQILLLVGVFGFWVVALNSIIVALGQQKKLLLSYSIAAIFNIVANLIFIPQFSYLASAIITLISELIILYSSTRILKSLIDFKIDFRALAKVIFASILMGGIIFALKSMGVVLVTIFASIFYIAFTLGILKLIEPKNILS